MSFYEWKQCKLKDIIEFNPKESIKKGSIVKKISMDRLEPFTKKINGYEETKFTSGSKFKNGDTLLARITPCLENGKTAYVDILTEDEIAFGSTEYIVLRKIPGITDKEYVYYLAISPEFRDIAIKSMNGSSGRQRVQREVLEESIIKLPLLSEQKKIAKILSDLDKKIEINNKINHNLENQINLIYKYMFVDNMDVSWKLGTIEDLGKVVGGSTPSKAKQEYYTDDGIAWITPKDLSVNKSKFINKGNIDITEIGFKNSSVQLMPKGTVLFSSRAPIGYIAIADNQLTTNQGFKSIVPFEKVGTTYVYCFLKNNIDKIKSVASGSTFKEVSGSVMKSIEAIVPSDEILENFNAICNPIVQTQRNLENENEKLRKIRDMLLAKLMNGEIDVNNISLEE